MSVKTKVNGEWLRHGPNVLRPETDTTLKQPGKAADAKAVGDAFTEILASNIAYIAKATLPSGRAKGDVTGNGVITEADAKQILEYAVLEEAPTDTVDIWVADVNGDGSIDAKDASIILAYISGTDLEAYSQYAADYYGNWTWDTGSHCYYHDIQFPGVTVNSAVSIFVKASIAGGLFNVTCMEDVIRIHARSIPTVDVDCIIVHSVTGSMAQIVHTCEVDATLSQEGKAADAQIVGKRLDNTLPLPPAVKAGQYMRVTAVDERGKVTALEAVSLHTQESLWEGALTFVETEVDGTMKFSADVLSSDDPPAKMFYEGETIRFTVDGASKLYTVGLDSNDSAYFGNRYLSFDQIDGQSVTGDDFCITLSAVDDGFQYKCFARSAGTFQIAIERLSDKINPKYIPAIDELVINGSDGKRYAISVDESGGLAATVIE